MERFHLQDLGEAPRHPQSSVCDCHVGRGAQGMNRVLFLSEAGESHKDVAAPLLIISLLERCKSADGEDLVLQALQRMANLLESYYHPSNTGQ